MQLLDVDQLEKQISFSFIILLEKLCIQINLVCFFVIQLHGIWSQVGPGSTTDDRFIRQIDTLEEDVFWLYIPVHNVLLVHVVYSEKELLDNIRSLSLVHPLHLDHMIIELAPCDKF